MQTLKPREWVFSNRALLNCIDAMLEKVTVNRDYDIPYLAGYSKDGKIFFVDKSMPEGYAEKDGHYINATHFMLFHEGIEKALIDEFNVPYEDAHEVAQHGEQSAVKAAGINPDEYNAFMEKWIKKAINKKEFNVPHNLDLTPYEGETHILRRMK